MGSPDTSFLQGLLRYPSPPDGNHRVPLLVQQAVYLRDNTTNFGGAKVRRENQQAGAEAGLKTGSRAEEEMWEQQRTGTPASQLRQPGITTTVLLNEGKNLAEGLYGKAEALGINKALLSTFGELRVGGRVLLLRDEYAGSALFLFGPSLQQKSVQAYQQQASSLSEIPTKPTWEAEPPQNYAIDLKKAKAANLASKLFITGQTLYVRFGVDALSYQWVTHCRQVLASWKPL